MLFNRMVRVDAYARVAEEGARSKLPITMHTGDSRDVADALTREPPHRHGSMRDQIPDGFSLK